jgi:hypothetical protein
VSLSSFSDLPPSSFAAHYDSVADLRFCVCVPAMDGVVAPHLCALPLPPMTTASSTTPLRPRLTPRARLHPISVQRLCRSSSWPRSGLLSLPELLKTVFSFVSFVRLSTALPWYKEYLPILFKSEIVAQRFEPFVSIQQMQSSNPRSG